MFATHYHELTDLADTLTGVFNLHVSVKESGERVIFLRKVEPGKADRSYGIEVARLAGLPLEVIRRARDVLRMHEQRELSVSEELSTEPVYAPVQTSIFEADPTGVLEELGSLNVDEMKPIDALNLLETWKNAPGPRNRRRLKRMLVAGIISGTSVDGIDVALVEIEGAGFDQRVRQQAFESVPYPAGVRQGVLSISNAATHTARLSQMNFLLGELFGEAVVEVCRRAGVALAELDLIGSHGQTIYHQAEASTLYDRRIASTLQIGEPAAIAARAGVPVVADFRPADMAVGGQGAPLVPYVDYLLYRHAELGRVSLNIGGIANLTAIPAGAEAEQVVAFDTGPGNMIIDALVSQFFTRRDAL